jgi:hypothetical protein
MCAFYFRNGSAFDEGAFDGFLRMYLSNNINPRHQIEAIARDV